MPHKIKPLPFKPPRLIGFSEDMVASHYENHYGARVRQLNLIESELAAIDWKTATRSTISGLMQEKTAVTNSVLLDEVYFDSLGGADGIGGPASEPNGELAHAINRDFGSVADWRQEFGALGAAAIDGSGWVILQWNGLRARLENVLAADHSQMNTSSVPLLCMDMYEHAYMSDFEYNVTEYIAAFLENIHWGRPALRFKTAIQLTELPSESNDNPALINPEELHRSMSEKDTTIVLDVCLLEDLPKRHDQLTGAICVKSDEVTKSIDALSKDKKIVVYCMYGYQVSENAVTQLRKLGFDAYRLAGGISGWRAMGGITVPYKS